MPPQPSDSDDADDADDVGSAESGTDDGAALTAFEPGTWSAHQLAALDDLRRAYAVTHDAFSNRELARLTFWRWLRVVGRLCEWSGPR